MTLLERLDVRWEQIDGAAATKIDRILRERREAATEIKRLRAALNNLSNAAAIVYSKFEPKDGPGETAKALLKMELGLKD